MFKDVLFTFYCEDVYFKKGLLEIFEMAKNESYSEMNHYEKKMFNNNKKKIKEYACINIVALTSKSILQKIPMMLRIVEKNDVFVFGTDRVKRVIRGIRGYENAVFFSDSLKIDDIKSLFKKIISKQFHRRTKHFRRVGFNILTGREKLVSGLLSMGKTQQEISSITNLSSKTVSAHLRSAMSKFYVDSLVEYQAKLLHLKGMGLNF